MKNKTVLIIEDDKQIRSFISFSLKTQNYNCIEVTRGSEAKQALINSNPDVIIMDLGLPDIDGVEIIRHIREFSDMPIIVVSGRDQDKEKIEALDAGADDYLTKPFSINELLARLRVIFRHMSVQKVETPKVFRTEELFIDIDNYIVQVDGENVHFTPMEFKIIALLVKNSGKVLTHSYILRQVWGSYLQSDAQTLRVFMANIRRKIEKNPTIPKHIITEVGIGYRFVGE